MKKNKKGLIAALVILVVLILVYLFLKSANLEEEDTDTSSEEKETVYEIDAGDIAALTVKTESGEYHFAHSEDAWSYEDDEKFPLNESEILNVVSSLTSISSLRELKDVENLGDYGLEEPEVKATVTDTEGNTVDFGFGDENDTVSGVYMSKSGSDSIYLVDSSLKSGLNFTLSDLAEKEEIPSITGSTVQSVEISKDGQTESLSKDDTSETGWTYKTAEGNQIAADSSKVSEFTNGFSGISWSDFVTYDTSDLSAYGLDNPTTVTVNYQVTETVEDSGDEDAAEENSTEEDTADKDSTDENAASEENASDDEEQKEVTVDKQAVFLIGKQDADGNYYGKMQDSKYIYTLSSSTVESITQINEEDMVSTLVAEYYFADLDKVTFVRNNNSYEVVKKEVEVEEDKENTDEDSDQGESEDNSTEEETKTETKYYINDKEIDKSVFSDFYSNVTGMEWQSRTSNEQVQGNPEMEITFEKEGGISATVKYYAYDSNFYLVVDSKGNEMLVNKMKVKEMLDSFDAMIKDWEEQ